MKTSKKFLMASSFILGVAILATSAFAEMMIGSGYQDLKEALKQTVLTIDYGINDSCTQEFSISIKDGDTLLYKEMESSRLDIENNRYDVSYSSYDAANDNEYNRYNYSDANMSYNIDRYGEKHVYLRDASEEYSVTNRFLTPSQEMENIFETEEAKDIERILDAFVGNLSSLVQMEENSGYTVFQGSIDATQIPAYANAIASFLVKRSVFDSYRYSENNKLPIIKGQVYISQISGKAICGKDGYITDLIGNAVLMGTDENGVEHTFTADLSFSISDVGTTVIEVPDTTGAEINEAVRVEKVEVRDIWSRLYPEDVGEYVCGISEYVDGIPNFIGVSTIRINTVNENGDTTGEYSIDYFDSDTNPEHKDFHTEFSYNHEESSKIDRNLWIFEYIDANGEQKTGLISRGNEVGLYFCPDVRVGTIRGSSTQKSIQWNAPEMSFTRIK